MVKALLSLSACILLCLNSFAATPPPEKPILESIEGAATVTLIDQAGTREISSGTPLEYGARIRTTDVNTATILYPDGSRLGVNQNSEFEIETKLDGTEWSKLRAGSVRGMITKPSDPKLKYEGKPRFLIRSKSAVLGVRGTDFLMGLNEAASEASVHTFEGTVEVASDEATVLSSKGTLVSDGQMVQANSSGLGQVQAFSKAEFMKSYQGTGGNLVPGAQASAEDLTGGSGASGTAGASGGGISVPTGAPAPSFAAPAPKLPPPPASPSVEPNKPDQQKEEEKKATEALENRRRIKLLSFQLRLVGMLLPGNLVAPFPVINDPNTGSVIPKILSISWDPSIPIPMIQPLSARAHLGLAWALGGDWEPVFPAQFGEAQAFLTVTFFKTLFFEAGAGIRRWGHSAGSFDAPLQTIMAGISVKGVIDRVFIGKNWEGSTNGTSTSPTLPMIHEYFGGIQISLYGD